ncbi:hypothetical protein NPIL_432271 [Nephila pilipes]|uniref:Uncharacterized protein n=1 Tax=Nephila pilipes TaxID=299642 RepID=A0A8X6QRI0_NEPPI|nr:hypothetical protein NPIL_432271 [Nephila pilipes]
MMNFQLISFSLFRNKEGFSLKQLRRSRSKPWGLRESEEPRSEETPPQDFSENKSSSASSCLVSPQHQLTAAIIFSRVLRSHPYQISVTNIVFTLPSNISHPYGTYDAIKYQSPLWYSRPPCISQPYGIRVTVKYQSPLGHLRCHQIPITSMAFAVPSNTDHF